MDIESRMTELEIKMTRQDDMVEVLNQTVYRQQKKIDELEALCAALARRVKDMQMLDGSAGPANEKPPHY